MKLFQESISKDGIRVWKGRHDGYTVFIKESMNYELGYVDKYHFVIRNSNTHSYLDSSKNNKYYNTVEDCKNAAIIAIVKDKQSVSF